MKETTHKRRQELTRMRRTGQYARAFCIWSHILVVSPCGYWSINKRNPLTWLVLLVATPIAGGAYFFKGVYDLWNETLRQS